MGNGIPAAFAVILALNAPVAPVWAAEPFKDFTFRSIKPPKQGAKKLITIQIIPEASKPKTVLASNAPLDVGSVDWFWDDISANIVDAGPGRFQAALDLLDKTGREHGMQTPRLTLFRQIVADHGTEILLATIGKKISPALVLAMIGAASPAQPSPTQSETQSTTGRVGLMQLIPAAAARFAQGDVADASHNIKAGVAYLEWLLDRFDHDPILALAAFHAGETAIAKHQGVPPIAQTRAYVPNVVAAFQVARALCLTLPELYSDGCVFDLKGGQ